MAKSLDFKLDLASSRAVQAKLLTLGPNVEKKVVGSGVRKAINVIAQQAKRNARKSKRSGLLAKSIGVKVKKYRSGVTLGIAGARSQKDARTGENPANIAHLVEFPVKPHTIVSAKGLANTKDVALGFQQTEKFFGKTVEHPGFAGRPFLGPAYQSKTNEAQKVYARTLAEGITKEAIKQGITTF